MFTGIVDHSGNILKSQSLAEGLRLWIQSRWDDLVQGESICVEGACLTVTGYENAAGVFQVDLSPETLRCTTLGNLAPGAPVNLERALRAGDRLGGHWVSGHVDGTATISHRQAAGDFLSLTVAHQNQAWQNLLLSKGWVAVNGVSLTVNETFSNPEGGEFKLQLIPATLACTTLGSLRVGSLVNLEFDGMAKILVGAAERWLKEKHANQPQY